MSVNLPIQVAKKHWSKKKHRVKPSAPGATNLNNALDELEAFAASLMISGGTNDEIRRALLERVGKGPGKEKSLLTYFAEFIEEKRLRTKPNTVASYATVQNHLKGFAAERQDMTPSSVDKTFLDDFASHLLRSGIGNRTVNKLVGYTGVFLRWVDKRAALPVMPVTAKLRTIRNAVVYLSPEELVQPRDVDLSDLPDGYAWAREIFWFMALTGQRFSDVHALKWEHISEDGVWWHIATEKVGIVTRIPLVTPARDVLSARHGEKTPLPQLSNQKTNAYLKVVAKRAGISARVTQSRLRGAEQETVTVPKHELITTHAARRTFITLFLHGTGRQVDLLGLTHRDLRSIRPYVGIDDERRRKRVEESIGNL